jgi:hypothetical protein
VPLAALATNDLTFWLVALGSGAAVLAIVAALLTLLLRIVVDTEERLGRLEEAVELLAASTEATWQLRASASTAAALGDELRSQRELLGRP